MPEIKSTSSIAQKWARVTPQRSQDYADGVQSPKRDWKAAAAAANDTYKAAVTKAANENRFAKGVNEAGTEKWQSRTLAKGPQRFVEGVQVAQGDYESGFAPYADVIRNTSLPPRFPKGDPRNLDRVAVLAKALNAKRVGGR